MTFYWTPSGKGLAENSKYLSKYEKTVFIVDSEYTVVPQMTNVRPGQIAHPMPIRCARACLRNSAYPRASDEHRARKLSRPNIFQALTFYLIKKEKPLDLQVFSRIGKTMKQLQSISNTIMNTNLLVIF